MYMEGPGRQSMPWRCSVCVGVRVGVSISMCVHMCVSVCVTCTSACASAGVFASQCTLASWNAPAIIVFTCAACRCMIDVCVFKAHRCVCV